MSVLIVQYENRYTDYTERLMARNRAYCNRHGYRYIRPTDSFNISPYWIKVALIKQCIESSDAKYIVWLDSDAVVAQQAVRIEDLFTIKDFLISYDYSDFQEGKYVANAGVFMIRVNERTKGLVNAWWNCYNPARWIKEGEKWKTTGKWAGPDYEQGSFNTIILPKFNDIVKVFNYDMFGCNTLFPGKESFSCHYCYPREKKTYIPLYLIASRKYELMFWLSVLGLTMLTLRKK